MENLYTILGLEPRASAEDIRTAYRRKARRVHPDVTGEQSAAEFVRLNRAYEILSDPQRRIAYDRQFVSYTQRQVYRWQVSSTFQPLEPAARSPHSLWHWLAEPSGLSELLTEMMSTMAEPAVESEGQATPLHVELVLSPQIARRGTEVRLDVPVTVVCTTCQGTGLAEPFICQACRGRGRWRDERPLRFFLQPPIRDGQTVTLNLQAPDVPPIRLYLHIRLSWL